MPEQRKVYSSHVNSVGYDEEAQEMTVEFSNGSVVVYSVPPDIASSVLSAPSIGEEIWRSVRGQFGFRYQSRAPGRK